MICMGPLAFAGACSGIVLWEALFPAFYYLQWIGYLSLLWGLVSLVCLGQLLTLRGMARWRRGGLPGGFRTGAGFIMALLVLVTLCIAFKPPLRVSFLLAKPTLEDALQEHGDDLDMIGKLPKYHDCGIYPIKGATRRCHRKDRIYFQFRNDGESAIIYSESGIDDLCYNSGSKGHLLGHWYWMKED